MNKKTKLTLCLALGLLLPLFVFCGCKNDNKKTSTNGNVSTQEEEIILSYTDKNLSMIVDDEKTPRLEITILSGKAPDFTSSDPSVATVDGEGKIKAVSKGKATITATYEGKTSAIEVSVGYGDYIPYLDFINSMDSEVTIGKSSFVNVGAVVCFNGKTFSDATLKYEVTNELGSVENGIFTPYKTGKGQIKVSATWRNYDASPLFGSIDISVVPEVQLYVNDNKTNTLEVYTKSSFGGNAFENVIPFVAKGYVDGEEVKPAVTVVSGEEKLTYNSGEQTISGVKSGEAVIRLTYEAYTHDVTVKVLPTIAKYGGEVIDFSALDGDLPLKKIFGEDVELISAYDEQSVYRVSQNKVLGIEVNGKSKPKARVITICTDECGYEVSVMPYTKIIKTGKDFEIFGLGNDVKINNGTVAGKVSDGYYVLGGNIDASDYVADVQYNIHSMSNILLQTGAGLTGTFDGRGYTINNLTLGSFGLFGIVSGTIKNVAFRNVKFLDAGKAKYTYVLANYIDNGACVENVYIKCKEMDYVGARATVANVVREKAVFNNCLFVLDSIRLEISGSTISHSDIGTKNLAYSYGSLVSSDFNRYSYVGNTTAKAWSNVYVISPYFLTAQCSNGFTTLVMDGENNAKGNYVLSDGKTVLTITDEQIKGTVEKYENLPAEANENDVYIVEKETRGEKNMLFYVSNTKFLFRNGKWEELITYYNYSGVKRYDSVEAMLAAGIDYTAFEESGYWSLPDGYIPVWTTTGDFPVEETDIYIELDQRTGEIDLSEIFKDPVNVERVEVRTDEDLTATLHGNVLKIWNGSEEFIADGQIRQLVFVTESGRVCVNVKICSAIISSLKDLQDVFKITEGNVVQHDAYNYQIEIRNSFNGYYVLANDITANDSDAMHRVLSDGVLEKIFEKFNYFPNRVPYFTGGLTGTFDGNGHTISNLKIGDCGLFGIVNGGTIKNVGLVNVKLYASAHSAKCTLGASMHNAKLENVYISSSGIDDDTLKPDGTTAESGDATCKRALLTILMGTVEMNNCVFECGPIEGKEKSYSFGYGSLAAYDNITLNPHAADREERRKWTNVYVISAEALVSHSGNLTNTNVTVVDAYNKKSTNDESVLYLKSKGETDDIAQGIKRYETQSEMTAAEEDLSSFEQSAFWTVKNGVPVFKN